MVHIRVALAALRIRSRIAALRLRTAAAWWLLTLSVVIRSTCSGIRRARSHGSLRARLSPRPGEWHRPGTFTVFDWTRATVVDVHLLRHHIALELQLEEGTITRVGGHGVWRARAPRRNVVRVLPLTEAYPAGEQLVLLPRGRACVRYVREQGYGRRMPVTPTIVERLETSAWATVPLRTAPATDLHLH